MEFADLDFQDMQQMKGYRAKVFFSNGYGASVIIGDYTYGGPQGLYELAVLKGTPDNWEICYDSPITTDVLGHLSPDQVSEYLTQIENFKY